MGTVGMPNDWPGLEDRRGWQRLVDEAERLTSSRWVAKPEAQVEVVDGRLQLAFGEPPGDGAARAAGIAAGARALSAETCERCGGKGDPVDDPQGQRTGSRCEACRTPQTVRAKREWAPYAGPAARVVSPGQWTADIRGGTSGADWDATDPANYGRLETLYAEPIARLMQANDDEEAVGLWTGSPGWAGLLRALFVTMRPEQDERPDDPNHKPWRLRWMKAKWGTLDVRTTGNTPFQFGVILMIEHMSGLVCRRCGRPGRIRHADHVRTECDECWKNAPAADRAADRERHREL